MATNMTIRSLDAALTRAEDDAMLLEGARMMFRADNEGKTRAACKRNQARLEKRFKDAIKRSKDAVKKAKSSRFKVDDADYVKRRIKQIENHLKTLEKELAKLKKAPRPLTKRSPGDYKVVPWGPNWTVQGPGLRTTSDNVYYTKADAERGRKIVLRQYKPKVGEDQGPTIAKGY